MRKIYKIGLSDEWVLKHRNDETLPIEVLKQVFSSMKGFVVCESTYNSLTFAVETDGEEAQDMKKTVCLLLDDKYGEGASSALVSWNEAHDSDDDSDDDEGEEESIFEKGRSVSLELGGDDDDDDAGLFAMLEAYKETTRRQDPVATMECINSLIGAKEFKALAEELVKVAPLLSDKKYTEVFARKCYLFSVSDGYGLTTYLNLFADIINSTKLRMIDVNSPVTEVKIDAETSSKNVSDCFSWARNAMGGSPERVKVVCLDICAWMDRLDSEAFRNFLRYVENSLQNTVVVFRVPFVDKEVLARIKDSLSDLLIIREVSFPPFNTEELVTYAKKELEKYGFTMAGRAWKYFNARIAEEKRDGRFYGINTVKKVVSELVYNKQLSNAGKKRATYVISQSDAKTLCEDIDASAGGGMEELDKLIGAEKIKRQVEEIIAQIEYAKLNEKEAPCVHMRFVGNPGTGKTTVARIVGKILKERGVLRIGNLHEVMGRDLCGRYVGETAPKTASICRDAYGSVLFIDEAYSLFRGDDGGKDFGLEALEMLIAEMENHRKDLVIIMAGYTDDMERLMQGNAGLRSRMPYCIEFPNFTKEQLGDIFASMAQGKFKCDQEVLDAARAYFAGLSDEFINSKEFSNARFVRNLFERTWAKAAMRCQLEGISEVTLTKADFERASSEKEFILNTPKRSRIGF